MPIDKAEKLKNLLKEANRDTLSFDDVKKFFKILADVIRDTKTSIFKEMELLRKETGELVQSTIKGIKDAETRLRELIKQVQDSIKDANKTVSDAKSLIKDTQRDVNRELSRIENLIPEMPDIESAKTEMQREIDRVRGMIPSIPDEETAEETRDKLESLKKGNRLGWEFIDGLVEELKSIRALRSGARAAGSVGAKDFITDIDISAQLDGSTKTFNLQAVYNIISVDLSSYPYGSLRKNIDYKYTSTTITFTSEINAVSQLASGQQCIITAVTS